ncbi:MAG: transcription antiterminator, partial [Erysipelotrichia bacterium]|nr:transcription antiterminator [Erysipelotrichia bacterium]
MPQYMNAFCIERNEWVNDYKDRTRGNKMLMLNDRQIDIVKCLLEKDEFITIESLAALFSVGARTVRYDLSQIKAYLLENSISLISKTNHGIKIIATDEEKNKVRNTLARSKQLNASDRKTAMLLSLLIYDHTTYEELADLCKVSKQTIITDFPEVEQYLADKQITVDKLKGSGISIQGSEIDIRHLFTNIIQGNHVDEWLFEDMLNQICKEPAFSISRQIIDTVEKTKNIRFYEHQSIEVCICYVLERIAKGYKIHEDAFHDRELTKEAESDVKVLEAYPFALEDKIVISNILQNAKRRSMNQHEISEDDAEAKEIADYLAERLQKLHPLDPAEKRRFIKGLTTHLAAAICRTRSGIEVKNELLNQIMISIPLLYEYTKKQLKDCEKTFNIEFGENEIAYISMYVTSAFENSVKVDT